MKRFSFFLACMLMASSIGAAIIHVPDNQPTIQAGINSAVEYVDTVLVADGVYTGEGNRDIDFGGKAVVLKSQNGPESTIIDCEGDSTNPHRGFIFNTDEDFMTVVQGFTIRNGFMYIDDTTITYGGGVRCDSTSPTIVDCIIEGCWAMMGGGISCNGASPRLVDCIIRSNYCYLWGGGMQCSQSSPILSGCLFQDDTSRHSGGAIYMQDNSFPSITDCRFETNFSWGGTGGIYCLVDCSPTFEECLFISNTGFNSYDLSLYRSCSPVLTNCTFFGGGIYCGRASSPTLDNCIIAFSPGQAVNCSYYSGEPCYPTLTCSNVYGNAGGDWVDCIAGQDNGNDNISADPLFCDTAVGDYHIDEISPCSPALSGCGTLIGAMEVGCGSPARVWLVNADGTGDAPTIQAAIDSCSTLDTVLLGPGTYSGTGNRDIELRGKSIILTSVAGPEQTVIDCGGSASEEHRGFYLHQGEDSTSLIEGLSVVNGYSDSQNGGAMLCVGSSPSVRNCIFRGNHANSGGAVACDELYSLLRFEACTLDSNSAGNNGGAIFTSSSIALANCVVSRNSATADGGAIHFYSNDTTMYSSDTSYLTFCIFVDNHAGSNGGALYMANASPYARNCTFYGHSNSYGGTVTIASYCSPFFDRCLIAFNEGPAAVACLSPYAYPYFWLCDIYGNSGGDWDDCIAGQYGVNCNFSADPWFCDTAVGNFQLFENSPCAPEYNVCDSLVGAFGVGCSGEMSTIEPDLMQLPLQGLRFTETATVCLGNLQDGYVTGDIDPSSVLVNTTIAPATWEVLPSHPDFDGEVFQITFPVEDLLVTYGLQMDTTVHIHNVSGEYNDQSSFSVDGTVTIVGHITGDMNDDGTIDVGDLTFLVAYLFQSGPPPPVPAAGDVDGSGSIDVGDLTYLVAYLFQGGPAR